MIRGAVLLALCVGYAEIGVRSQRMLRYLSHDTIWSNPMSAWSFAAVIVLPAGLATAFIAAQYGHYWIQRRRERSGQLYRVLFTAATAMCAQLAVGWLIVSAGARSSTGVSALGGSAVGSLVILAGVPLFLFASLALLVVGRYLSSGRPPLRGLLPARDGFSTELGALVLGIVVAEFLVHSPVLVPAVVVVVAAFQRSTTVKALHTAARTDVKTGLLTAAAWTTSAQAMLSRCAAAGTTVAVLLIDLDRFKQVNDEHGHLAGDEVLGRVGKTLKAQLREHDAVGRFGGEEFVAVLAGASAGEAAAAGERLRIAMHGLPADFGPVTASIGVAHWTPSGTADVDLDDLLAAADRSLYDAKNAGRDCVRTTQVSAAAAVSAP